jgi:hypothetical protein
MVSTAGAVVIAIVVVLLATAIAWALYTKIRAQRLGVRIDTRTTISDEPPV